MLEKQSSEKETELQALLAETKAKQARFEEMEKRMSKSDDTSKIEELHRLREEDKDRIAKLEKKLALDSAQLT